MNALTIEFTEAFAERTGVKSITLPYAGRAIDADPIFDQMIAMAEATDDDVIWKTFSVNPR